MALKILEECISCDVCIEECPNEAIEAGSLYCSIDPDKCTECIDKYDEPICITVCPVDCIVSDKDHVENVLELRAKYKQN